MQDNQLAYQHRVKKSVRGESKCIGCSNRLGGRAEEGKKSLGEAADHWPVTQLGLRGGSCRRGVLCWHKKWLLRQCSEVKYKFCHFILLPITRFLTYLNCLSTTIYFSTLVACHAFMLYIRVIWSHGQFSSNIVFQTRCKDNSIFPSANSYFTKRFISRCMVIFFQHVQ